MKHVDTIIVGAGISGISLSRKLNQENKENIIFESNEIGGCIATANYKNFWFEMGAHTLYNSYSSTIDFIKDSKFLSEIISRRRLPFLFVKSNNKIESIFSNLNWPTLIFKYLKNKNISKKNKTVSQYSKKIFGENNYSNTFKHCFNAVLSQNSEDFPMEYLFKKYPRDKNLPKNFTLKKGLSSLLKNNSNIIHEKVITITKNDNKWIVKTTKNIYSCINICLATPWCVTKELLKSISPQIAKHPNAPTTSKITSIGIIIHKNDLKQIKNLAGMVGKNHFFYSAVSRDIVKDKQLRAITFHCKEHNIDKNDLMYKISKLLDIDQMKILYTKFKYHSLPKYNIDHKNFLEDLDIELIKQNNLFITGNFFNRLAIENCIKRSNIEFNRIIQRNIVQ